MEFYVYRIRPGTIYTAGGVALRYPASTPIGIQRINFQFLFSSFNFDRYGFPKLKQKRTLKKIPILSIQLFSWVYLSSSISLKVWKTVHA